MPAGRRQVPRRTCFFEARGHPVARRPGCPDDLPDDARFPLLVKAREGFGSRHIYRAEDRARSSTSSSSYTTVDSLVQQVCEGEEFSIDVFCDLEGRCLNAIPRTMIESKGGESIKGMTIKDAELIEHGRRVAETLGIVGPANIQCFREPDGSLPVTDVNPRFGGAFPLPRAAGSRYPELALALARRRAAGAAARRLPRGRRDDAVLLAPEPDGRTATAPSCRSPRSCPSRSRPSRDGGLALGLAERPIASSSRSLQRSAAAVERPRPCAGADALLDQGRRGGGRAGANEQQRRRGSDGDEPLRVAREPQSPLSRDVRPRKTQSPRPPSRPATNAATLARPCCSRSALEAKVDPPAAPPPAGMRVLRDRGSRRAARAADRRRASPVEENRTPS